MYLDNKRKKLAKFEFNFLSDELVGNNQKATL